MEFWEEVGDVVRRRIRWNATRGHGDSVLTDSLGYRLPAKVYLAPEFCRYEMVGLGGTWVPAGEAPAL